MCVLCLIFLLGVYVITGINTPQCTWPVDDLDGRRVTVAGTVVDRQIKSGNLWIFVSDVSFFDANEDNSASSVFPENSKGIIIKCNGSADNAGCAKIGSRIEATGVFAPFERPRCEGAFDLRTYYLIRGYEGSVVRARLDGTSKGYDHVKEALRGVREDFFSILKDNMSEDDAGLVAAMTLGDKTELSQDIKESYQNAGISHVLALSGLHIASVGLAILKVLRKAGLSLVPAHISAFVVIASYSVMTGLSVSTVRAMLMFGLFTGAKLIGRTYDLLSAAAMSAIMVIIGEPYYIYDSGFLLSFGAILGIACIYPILVTMPQAIMVTWKPGRIYKSVCISLSVMIVTMPVMGTNFMQFSPGSILLNLVVIPLMGAVLFTGFTGMIMGSFGLDPGLILKITHYILWFFVHLSKTSEKIDGNIMIIGKPEMWQIITYAFFATIAVLCEKLINNDKYNNGYKRKSRNYVNPTGQRNFGNNGSYGCSMHNKITYIIETNADRNKKKRTTVIVHGITIVILMTAMLILMIRTRHDLEIRNVDVGQGDCALIWGRTIPCVMIDGGSSDINDVAKYRVLPTLKANGISGVKYCFLTHMDSDHVSAVIQMLEDDACPVRIGNIVVSANVMCATSPEENFLRLQSVAKRRDTGIIPVASGQKLDLGELSISCISPDIAGAGPADANDDSLVLIAKYHNEDDGRDFSAVFTGDISTKVEERIRSRLCDVNYLKVAHHGSRTSTGEDFLALTRPELAVISVGIDNSYGHPTPETLGRLKNAGTKMFRTDINGEVIATYDDGELRAYGYIR